MNCLYVVISLNLLVSLCYSAAQLILTLRETSDRLFFISVDQAVSANQAAYKASGLHSKVVEKWLSEDQKQVNQSHRKIVN